MADIQLEFDNKELLKELDRLDKKIKSLDKKALLSQAAKPFIAKARELAPVADDVVHRYNTPKLVKSIRAPKGMGNIVASYLPGNLRGSIGILRHGVFRKIKNAVFIGPKLARRNPTGTFGKGRFDGWYAHFLEFGTANMSKRPFIRPAWEATKTIVEKHIETSLRRFLR